MPIMIEEVQRMLTQAPAKDIAEALKEWRAQMAYSQAEAAIRLGVSLRTLQGWEMGVSDAVPDFVAAGSADRRASHELLCVVASRIPREFAEFIDFVGAEPLDKQTRTVEQRLRGLKSPCARFMETAISFRWSAFGLPTRFGHFGLDVTNSQAVRAASLIAGINRVRGACSPPKRPIGSAQG